MTTAIIVAAGSSSRMKTNISKQLIELDGIPVIIRTINVFEFLSEIDSVLIVTRKCDIEIIKKLASEESCVIVGRCADYALEDFDNCLSVYVHAPFEDRIKRIETEYGIVKEKSKEVLMKKDKQRSSYYNYYSSNKWGDAKSYDLCLNSSYLGIDGSVEMIKKVIDMKESQE